MNCKRLHPSTTAARFRALMKNSQAIERVKIDDCLNNYSYYASLETSETIILNVSSGGYVSFLEYYSADKTEHGWLMNPDSIILKKVTYAIWRVLNERKNCNELEKILAKKLDGRCRYWARGYAKYFADSVDVLNA